MFTWLRCAIFGHRWGLIVDGPFVCDRCLKRDSTAMYVVVDEDEADDNRPHCRVFKLEDVPAGPSGERPAQEVAIGELPMFESIAPDIVKAGCPMPVEIKPGPELDCAVAEAIGLGSACVHHGHILITPREWDEMRGVDHTTCEGNVACTPFNPSTDLNAAFAAAEKAGLLLVNGDLTSPTYGLSILHYEYAVKDKQMEWVVRYRFGDRLSSAPTLALAICAAILKLKEKEE